MNLFVNITNATDIDQLSDGIALRWAYIFATRVITTSVASSRMYFYKYIPKMNMRERISLTRMQIPATETETRAQFEEAVKIWELLMKKKTRGKADFLLLRRAEDVISSVYNHAMNCVGIQGKLAGMKVMGELPIGKELTYYSSDPKDPERRDNFIPMSRVLQLRDEESENKAPDDITFLLPVEFMDTAFRPGGICSPNVPEALEEGAIWMERVMEVPDIIVFDALEIQLLRGQMQQEGAALLEVFRQWTVDAFTGAKSAAERLDYYRKQVRPAAEAWRSGAAQSKLLNKVRAAAGRDMIEVWLGELPMQTIWNFYHAAGAITEPTWEALSTPAARERGRMRIPVVAIALAGGDAPEQGAEEAQAAEGAGDPVPGPARKRLLLD